MKAYGYCRYSSDNQNEASIEQQKNELTEYANKNNITIIDFYCDEAQSGTKDTRENFQNMISDCKKKKVEAVLVWKTDRFARNTQDSLMYKMKLEKLGVQLISITQPIDTSTPEGSLMYTFLAGIDEYYSKNLASNVKRALKMNAQNCQFNGGIPPLGYDVIDKQYVINEREAEIIRLIFKWYIDGQGIMEIASNLNLKGYKTKKGQPFGKNSIYDIIGNERYTGTYIFNKGTKHNHEGNPNEIRIENGMPQIISKETFEKAMIIRNRNKTMSGSKIRNSHIYLLSGLIFCGKCNARYCGCTSTKTTNNKKFETGYYKCSNRNKLGNCDNHIIKQLETENIVYKSLIETILNGNSISQLVDKIKIEYMNLKEYSKNEVSTLKTQLQQITRKKNNLIELVAETKNKDLINKINEYTLQEEELKEKISFYEQKSYTLLPEDVANGIKKDISNLSSNNKEEVKKIIQKYVKRITVYNDKIKIEYTFTDKLTVGTLSGFDLPLPDKVANFLTVYVEISNVIAKKRQK